MASALTSLIEKIRLEPAVIAGLLSAIGLAVANQEFATWESLAAVIVSVIVRQLVVPAPKVETQKQEAFFEGVYAERQNGQVIWQSNPSVTDPPI
jgi:hypothetical protein